MSEKIEPVAWAMTDYQPEANTQYTGDKYAAEHWGSQGIQIEPLFSAATVSALEARVKAFEAVCQHILDKSIPMNNINTSVFTSDIEKIRRLMRAKP